MFHVSMFFFAGMFCAINVDIPRCKALFKIQKRTVLLCRLTQGWWHNPSRQCRNSCYTLALSGISGTPGLPQVSPHHFCNVQPLCSWDPLQTSVTSRRFWRSRGRFCWSKLGFFNWPQSHWQQRPKKLVVGHFLKHDPDSNPSMHRKTFFCLLKFQVDLVDL